jgi:8-oxo-dGTP diphosphatase
MKQVLVAAAALVDTDGRVLLTERPQGKHLEGTWEFPGGKVEKEEAPLAALIRELQEELSIDISNSCIAPLTFVTHTYDEFELLLLLYITREWKGFPQSNEGQNLRWVRPRDMADLTMPPADVPLVAALRDHIGV